MKQNSIKSFTLIEMLISITLFSILIIVLYGALDISKRSNKIFSDKLEEYKKDIKIKRLLFEDFINSSKMKKIMISDDKDGNSIVRFETTNSFHNLFYNHITYRVTKKHNLFRIEQKYKPKTFRTNEDRRYIDTILTNIDKFEVVKDIKNKNIQIYIKYNKTQKIDMFIKLLN